MSMRQPDARACMQIVTAWNGLAMGALARAARLLASEPDQAQRKLFPVTGRPAKEYVHGGIFSRSVLMVRLHEHASGGFGKTSFARPHRMFAH